ncbi:nitrate/sulfonate/bicarbonate ABC transporter, permease protein [Campylobacter blaseri]|uniref:ABC transporter permease n=1 Tax=Campylobacter blaseri TaxID=2042961 RepID=A0A2P8R3L1_9BACT|nr:ABC transporter permease subunit [Campylobacter blaseri]PSM53084.1 ABC transporter permease [Campylobacter blaseri]PSM54551.1 ABC transporter permease [Campylobacter blaseri]QKF86978.1 nitrate/sulfonate/bicarbonate ABC transporter, permease protein [Campylobacter blaseri]
MIITDGVPRHRNIVIKIFDYLWGGFATLSVIFLMVAIWQIGHEYFGSFILPSPIESAKKAFEILKNYSNSEINITLQRTIIGIGIACIGGIMAGLIAGYFKTMSLLLKPISTFLLAMPPIIWVVLALFWFGFGNASTIFTIIVTVIPLTFASSMIAMATVDESLKEVFDIYNLSIFKKIKHLYIPHIIPYIISSISIAFGMGVKIVIMVELLSSTSGVGSKIADARSMLEMDIVLGYTLLIIVFISLFEYLVIKPLEILLMPWRR